jgi:hypothetical protein
MSALLRRVKALVAGTLVMTFVMSTPAAGAQISGATGSSNQQSYIECAWLLRYDKIDQQTLYADSSHGPCSANVPHLRTWITLQVYDPNQEAWVNNGATVSSSCFNCGTDVWAFVVSYNSGLRPTLYRFVFEYLVSWPSGFTPQGGYWSRTVYVSLP